MAVALIVPLARPPQTLPTVHEVRIHCRLLGVSLGGRIDG